MTSTHHHRQTIYTHSSARAPRWLLTFSVWCVFLALMAFLTGCGDDGTDPCDGLERATFCVEVLDSMGERVQPTSVSFSVDGSPPETLETDSCTPEVDCCIFNQEQPGFYEITVLVEQDILMTTTEIAPPAEDSCHIETAQIELLLP